MISFHPHKLLRPESFNPLEPCRHFIQSPAFARRFRKTSQADIFRDVASYCGSQSGGPLGEAELILTDDNGTQHYFFLKHSLTDMTL